jgi:hypothetical protein
MVKHFGFCWLNLDARWRHRSSGRLCYYSAGECFSNHRRYSWQQPVSEPAVRVINPNCFRSRGDDGFKYVRWYRWEIRSFSLVGTVYSPLPNRLGYGYHRHHLAVYRNIEKTEGNTIGYQLKFHKLINSRVSPKLYFSN